ncbi:related to Cop9 signalosome complex subunit 11 [Zygosaccharomyces bailii]|nr:related to Cop9 signalosome complex subunit 11 [Zygosaccharomyces bailii]
MLEGLEGAILVEKANHLISRGLGEKEDRKRWAREAVTYICNVGCTNTPYWDKLLTASELECVPEISTCKSLVMQKTIAHDYVDAIALLENSDVASANHCRNLERITQVLLLSHNFKELEEIEYQTASIDPSRQESLEQDEAEALSRVKLLNCASYYLRGKYFDCSSNFFKLLTNEPSILNSLAHETSRKFLTNSEFLMMIVISTLLAVPLDNYEDFVSVKELVPFQSFCPTLYICLDLLINTSFRKFFQQWHGDINKKCIESFFLIQSWENAQSMMRDKIYFFYLRISYKVEVSYLSRILGIEEPLVRDEIENFIKSAHLNFQIQGDLVSYKHTHYLENVAGQLQVNERLISKRLEVQSSRNKNLRDVLQNMIISNDIGGRVKNEDVAGNNLRNSGQIRYEDSDNMEVDEINDVSDVDSPSIEIGN